MGKIFTNHIYYLGMIFGIYKELLQLSNRKMNKNEYDLKICKGLK
jgi:hypothetical protein